MHLSQMAALGQHSPDRRDLLLLPGQSTLTVSLKTVACVFEFCCLIGSQLADQTLLAKTVTPVKELQVFLILYEIDPHRRRSGIGTDYHILIEGARQQLLTSHAAVGFLLSQPPHA